MNRILVTGAYGQVGQELQRSNPIQDSEFLFFGKKELNILSPSVIEKIFKKVKPTHVVNLAAYTDVEKAEHDEKNAFALNVIGPRNLGEACKNHDALLVHFSTDYVFGNDGNNIHNVEDLPDPLNVYGKTKLLGEYEVIKSECQHVILRTSWVYSNFADNFYTKILKLSQKTSEINVIDDKFGSPTSTKEICRALDAIVIADRELVKSGVYHFSGSGKTSWKEFAQEIIKQSRIPIIIRGTSTVKDPTKAERPDNSYLSSIKFSNNFNYFPMHWKNALKEVVAEKKITPVKVGYLTTMNDTRFVIASVDWSKEECVIADIDDMGNYLTLNFNEVKDL